MVQEDIPIPINGTLKNMLLSIAIYDIKPGVCQSGDKQKLTASWFVLNHRQGTSRPTFSTDFYVTITDPPEFLK